MSGSEMVGNFVTTEHANAGTGLGDGLMAPRGQLNDMWTAAARPDPGAPASTPPPPSGAARSHRARSIAGILRVPGPGRGAVAAPTGDTSRPPITHLARRSNDAGRRASS